MRSAGLIGIGLVELGATAYVSYLALPEHERQRVRMLVLRVGATTAGAIAEKFGRIGLRLELAYTKETIANG